MCQLFVKLIHFLIKYFPAYLCKGHIVSCGLCMNMNHR